MRYLNIVVLCIAILICESASAEKAIDVLKNDTTSNVSKFDTVEVNGVWIRKRLYEKGTKLFSGWCPDFFLFTDRVDTIDIKDVAEYTKSNRINSFVLSWNYDADLFFATFPDFPERKMALEIKRPYSFPTEGSKKVRYKKDQYEVCEYKLRCIRRVVSKGEFSTNVFLSGYKQFISADSAIFYLEIEQLYKRNW
jgi:hypothetical protein